MSLSFKTFVVSALAASTTAHMIITDPKPYLNSIGGVSYTDFINSPLADDGSDYPCHMVGAYDADFSTEYELGSTQTLAFMGSAVHGGGSCQVSITYDESPTKESVFKVIHSIEGGCPAKNQAGNFPDDASLVAPDTYNFNVPSDIPTGPAVLAWTWFNRVGNREMYMNCAPVTITGSGGDVENFNALPDIMVANIGEKQCIVAEGDDVQFPNPGDSVDQFPFTEGQFQDVSSQEACSFNWMAGTGPGSVDAPASDDSDSGDDTVTTTAAASNPTADVPGGVFITVGNDEDDDATTTTTAAPTTLVSSTTTTAEASQPTEDSSTGGDGSSESTACSVEGAFNCTGGGFQQCANGVWTAVRDMAAGTECTPGEGMDLDVSASEKTRKMRARRARRARAFRA